MLKPFFDFYVNLLLSRQIIIRYNRRKQIDQTFMEAKLFKKSRIAFRTNTKLALLTTPLQSTQVSSYSFILTLAAFLNSVKRLLPPYFMPVFKKKSSSQYKNVKVDVSELENYFEPWCDYLFTLVSQGKLTTLNDEVILIGKMDEDSFKIIESLSSFEIKSYAFSQEKNVAILEAKQLVNPQANQQPMQNKKKIGIINFSTSTLNHDKLKPKMHLEGLLAGIFYNPAEEWRAFRILRNDIPKVEELIQYNTIFLSGSSYSVNRLAPQMEQFQGVLAEALKINKDLKVLGICFGHQFIANSESIQVEAKTLDKGLLDIHFSFENSSEVEYLNQLVKSDKSLRLYKYHSDHVTSIPNSFFKLGDSSKCSLESLISKDKRILSFQFHPEYTEEFIQNYELRLSLYQKVVIAQQTKMRDDFHHQSTDLIRRTMRNFINWIPQH